MFTTKRFIANFNDRSLDRCIFIFVFIFKVKMLIFFDKRNYIIKQDSIQKTWIEAIQCPKSTMKDLAKANPEFITQINKSLMSI